MADLEAILARVEEELGEDARAALEAKIAEAADGDSPITNRDVREAMAGEMKAAGDGQGEGDVPAGAITEEELDAELERRFEEIRAELDNAVTEEDVDEALATLRESAKAAIATAVPQIADHIGQKMATGRRPSGHGVAPAPTSSPDYGDAIEEGFSKGRIPDTGVRFKLDYDAPGAEGSPSTNGAGEGQGEVLDYSEQIEAAFGSGPAGG